MQIMQIGIFQYIFYQYSIIWIQLTFYFFNFIIRWSILCSTFLSKILCIYIDIKKVIHYFWIDMKLNIPRYLGAWTQLVCVNGTWMGSGEKARTTLKSCLLLINRVVFFLKFFNVVCFFSIRLFVSFVRVKMALWI